MKKILLWTFFVAITCLAILSYVGYRSFNTEAFKDQIVRKIQELTGRTFTINGPYALTWDPLPTITLENVTLSNMENSTQSNMFKADKVQVQIEWASLFSSPTRIKNVLIINPEVLVERVSHSVSNIHFPYLFAAQKDSNSEPLLDQYTTQAQIDNIQIENGQLHYLNHMWKQDYLIEQLTGEIAYGSTNGPFGFKGTGKLKGIPLEFDISLAEYEATLPVRLWGSILAPDSQSQFKFDGKVYPDNLQEYLTTSLMCQIGNANTLLKQLNYPVLPEQYSTNLEGTAELVVNAQNTTLSHFVLKTVDNEAFSAQANYTMENTSKKAELKLEIPNLDGEIWQQTLNTGIHSTEFLNAPLQFDITLSNLLWNQQTATGLHLTGQIDGKQIQVQEGSVLLPGSTTIQMSGSLDRGQDWQMQSKVDLQSQDLPTTLSFFKATDNSLLDLAKNFKTAEASSTVTWTPKDIQISIPALSLDQSVGKLDYTQISEQPLSLKLELNHLNLNPYLPVSTKTSYTLKDVQTWLSNFFKTPLFNKPTQLSLTLNDTTVKKADFKEITATLNETENSLQLELSALTSTNDVLSVHGKIQNFGTPQWNIEQNNFDIKLANLPQFLKYFDIEENNSFVQNAHELLAKGTWLGNQDKWQIDLSYQALPYAGTAVGVLQNDAPQNLALHLEHASLPHLLVDFLGKNPFSPLEAAFVFDGELTQTDKKLTISEMSAQIGQDHFQGNLDYNLDSHELNATIATDKMDLAKLLPDVNRLYLNGSTFDDTPFNFEPLKAHKGSLNLHADTLVYQTVTFKDANLQAHLDDNTLHLDTFSATGSNQASLLQVNGSLNFKEKPILNLGLKTQEFPLTTSLTMFRGKGLSEGILSSEWQLSATGENPLQLVRNLNGSGNFNLQNSTGVGMNIAALPDIIEQAYQNEDSQEKIETKLKAALEQGSTPVQSLGGAFTVNEGLLQMNAGTLAIERTNSSSVSIDWSIPQNTLKAIVPLKVDTEPDLPDIVLTFVKAPEDVSYDIQTEAFAQALEAKIHQKQVAQLEANQKAMEEALQQELNEIKGKASQAFQELTNNIRETEQALSGTQNASAQQKLNDASAIQQRLSSIMNASDTILEQYQYVLSEIEIAQNHLKDVHHLLSQQHNQTTEKNAKALLQQADDLISKINAMYKKRPHIALLADLLQNTQKQREIMERAQHQFEKNLTDEQTEKVFKIIQTALGKINRAYKYAQGIYSGRQEKAPSGSIKRVGL